MKQLTTIADEALVADLCEQALASPLGVEVVTNDWAKINALIGKARKADPRFRILSVQQIPGKLARPGEAETTFFLVKKAEE